MLVVEYPPGGVDPVHRHDAHAFLYVLEGTIVMGLQGGKEVTLHAGETFHEGPNDIHTVGRNASKTEPAKFVVVPLILTSFYLALAGRLTVHRKLSRFTFPVWLYVSVTGVLIFAMLKLFS
jgi:hypothetical protein